MPRVRVNGVELYYSEQGSGPETIVFSHSYIMNGEHFQPQIEALSGRYRCIAYDHRGHGRSEVPRAGYEMQTIYADGVALIEALGCAPCHWVGLSTGGFVGLRVAIRRPELLRSLVLMDTSADEEPAAAARQYRLLGHVVRFLGWRPVIGIAMSKLFGRKFLTDPARRAEVRAWRARIMATDRYGARQFGLGIFSRDSVHAELGRIKLPTLVMVGEKDVSTPPARARRIAEGIEGAELVLVPDAGHLSTLEEPAAVNQALERFLAAQG